jgi:hypothetical protein
MVSRMSLVALAIGCVLSARAVGGQTAGDNTVQHFTRNVSAYLVLRQHAAASVPKLTVTSDPARLERAEADLGKAIRAARSGAHQGDIFSADVAVALRRRLSATVRQHALTATGVVAQIDEDVTKTKDRVPVVNGRFVWDRGSVLPIEILNALPELPAGLEYTFVDRTLVLVDVDADLIVDILPDALRDK